MSEPTAQHWPRMIALVDMNAFFASIEQLDRPEWRGRTVCVTNGERGTCIITCSYEARAYGIKTGMRLPEARRRCPNLIQAPSRPVRYAAASTAIMDALVAISPDIDVFSVDEAFLDLTHCQSLYATDAATLGQCIKQTVFEATGLLCSVGISGDKTTAKYAAKLNKPDGLTVIPPWQAKSRLADVPVTELCGIAGGIGRYLAERGVVTCGDMARLPISELGRRFGNPGRRIWLMAQGRDPEPVASAPATDAKTFGHGKVMPPNTTSHELIITYLEDMAFKLARRLRRHGLTAQHFSVGLRTDLGWLGTRAATAAPANDTAELMRLVRAAVDRCWHGEGIHQVQFTATDPAPPVQGDLFETEDPRASARDRVADAVAEKFGQGALVLARLLGRSEMPDVIAPAWRPGGHRQNIEK